MAQRSRALGFDAKRVLLAGSENRWIDSSRTSQTFRRPVWTTKSAETRPRHLEPALIVAVEEAILGCQLGVELVAARFLLAGPVLGPPRRERSVRAVAADHADDAEPVGPREPVVALLHALVHGVAARCRRCPCALPWLGAARARTRACAR